MSIYWIKYRGTRFPVRRGETILGRSPYSSIVVSNSLVSREHCALRLLADGLQIIDLDSTNGTTVNGDKVVGSCKLSPGDVIGVGTDLLEVYVVDGNSERDVQTRREPITVTEGPGDPDTQATQVSVDLIEALVLSASESQNPRAVASTIQRAVDGLLTATVDGVRDLDGADCHRLLGVIDRVCGWYDDDSLADWRKSATERIERMSQ